MKSAGGRSVSRKSGVKVMPFDAVIGLSVAETVIQEYFGSAPSALAARSGSTTELNAIIGKPGNSNIAKPRVALPPCRSVAR